MGEGGVREREGKRRGGRRRLSKRGGLRKEKGGKGRRVYSWTVRSREVYVYDWREGKEEE